MSIKLVWFIIIFALVIPEASNFIPQKEIIIQLHHGEPIEQFVADWNESAPYGFRLDELRTLSERTQTYLASTYHFSSKIIALLKRHPNIATAQWNHPVDFRGLPNDPFVGRQWSLGRIGLEEVWEKTRGGLTTAGDTIVVAILDSGFDVAHEDLQDNLWSNRLEIPGDRIDNDGNGYIDDQSGWNFVLNAPFYLPDNHGTAVAGIIGARGNNRIGVSGVNWHVQLMLFQISAVDDIIEAYDYIIDQRQQYNQTGGREGAYIVATNASFGAENIFCEQEPAWRDMYDELGKAGILSAVAASNKGTNIDFRGDVPTTCPSPYIIGVLNTNQQDEKAGDSSFSTTHIDLGAPGEDSYTLKMNSGYGGFGGNSAATPHVTGAIALLYAMACEDFIAASIRQPAQAALDMRDILLKNTDLIVTLNKYTATGGRLNVARAVEGMQQACGVELSAPLKILALYPNPGTEELTIDYEMDNNQLHTIEVFSATGQLLWQEQIKSSTFSARSKYILELPDWPAGVYFVCIKSPQRQSRASFVKL